MSGVPLLVLAAGLAAAAESPTAPLDAAREKIRTSLKDLDGALPPLEDLTASYASQDGAPDPARREAVRAAVSDELGRLDTMFGDFWPLWDTVRFAQGARIMGGILAGSEKPEAGGAFLDDTEIEDFKADVRRVQDRAREALKREERAYESLRSRRKARLADRAIFAGGGAALAGLAAAAAYALRRPS